MAATSRAMPSDRQAVGAVRRDLERDQRVVELEHVADVGAHGRVGGQREQARGIGVDAELAAPSTACPAIRRRAWSRPRCEARREAPRRRSRTAPSCRRRRWARRRRCASARPHRCPPCTRAGDRRSDADRPSSILPTTTPEKGGAAGSDDSTSSPAIVSRSHRPAVSSGGSTIVRSQRSENFIGGPQRPHGRPKGAERPPWGEATSTPGVGARASIPSIDARNEARASDGVVDAARRARRGLSTGVAATGGAASGMPVMAAMSRAMPSTDRQSARFGVILSVISVSSSASASRRSAPDAARPAEAPASRRVVVDAELARRAQHALRFDAAHRGRARCASPPGSSRADGRARRQHADGGVGRAADDAQAARRADVDHAYAKPVGVRMRTRLRRSARRRRRRRAGAAGSVASTSSPAIVSCSHSPAVSSGGSTIVRSQRSENFMRMRYLRRTGAGSAGRSRRTGAGR